MHTCSGGAVVCLRKLLFFSSIIHYEMCCIWWWLNFGLQASFLFGSQPKKYKFEIRRIKQYHLMVFGVYNCFFLIYSCQINQIWNSSRSRETRLLFFLALMITGVLCIYMKRWSFVSIKFSFLYEELVVCFHWVCFLWMSRPSCWALHYYILMY